MVLRISRAWRNSLHEERANSTILEKKKKKKKKKKTVEKQEDKYEVFGESMARISGTLFSNLLSL